MLGGRAAGATGHAVVDSIIRIVDDSDDDPDDSDDDPDDSDDDPDDSDDYVDQNFLFAPDPPPGAESLNFLSIHFLTLP